MFLMSSSVPVLTFTDVINHHPDTYDLFPVDDVDHVEDLASNILARLASEQTQDAEKTIPKNIFLQKVLPSSHPFQEYKPQGTKRGGKMFNKRTRFLIKLSVSMHIICIY